jgi:sugar transferase (PEP-CTERM/EpsH1 system associated)
MPIRIMHVLDNIGRGGMQNGLANLIAYLDPARFHHVVCSIRRLDHSMAHRFPPERAHVMCVATQRMRRVQIPALASAIREVRPDIVHSRNWSGIEAVVAARWTGSCAVIHSEHGIDSETIVCEPRRRLWFRRVAFEMADCVFCVSDQLRRVHAKRTRFPERKISVIHNGVDTQRFFPDRQARSAMRREFGLREDEFCIGCIGNLTLVKDYPTVIRALRELGRHTKAWRLLVLGEGSELPTLKRQVGEDPILSTRVQFLGLSDRVRDTLNAFDVYVLSSITEGISNSLLEAMATGLPVVATTTGGNPEVVIDGSSGLLFPVGEWKTLAEVLLTLLHNPEQRQQLSQRALRRIHECFALQRMVNNYQNLYENLAHVARVSEHAEATA